MNTNLLSVGMNRKLDKYIAVCNLPSHKTCPGKTKICSKICYATKSERIYGYKVNNKRRLVFEESLKDTFVEKIISELKNMSHITRVRLHESGDFYSQKYLDKWIKIAKALPHITFLAYTRSFNLDFSGRPKNFIVYWSFDASTKTKVPKGRTAKLVLKDETPPKNAVTCKHKSRYNYCGRECHICWKGAKNVYFIQH